MSSISQTAIFLSHPKPGDEVVISGLAGTYPESSNVEEFKNNLFNKKDLVNDNKRWTFDHPELPVYGGRLRNIQKFDAAFFGISNKHSTTMDPMGRLLLEKTFEAIVDAGMHPSEFRGTKTGVFLGMCYSESERYWTKKKLNPLGLPGCIRSMLANRISHWLGVNGPSFTIDTACSASSYAMEEAYRAIRLEQCDMAIVAGCSLCLHPYLTLHFSRMGALSMTGKSKCFDEEADGYTRSEAVVVTVLQKSKDARRKYCEIVHIKVNVDGFKESGITHPSTEMQFQLLKELYMESGVNPLDVDYVEAHATGTRVGDPEEVSAISKLYRPQTCATPLLIGSIKCSIGNTEPSSALCSITKGIISMETGYLVPNIHFNTPKKEIKALHDGRLKVVTDKMRWDGKYFAVNNFGIGGTNCHMLFKSNNKEKYNNGMPKDNIPRLVYVSGRTKESVNTIIEFLSTKPIDAEFIALLHEAFKYDIPAHNHRAYVVLSKNGVISSKSNVYSYDEKNLTFVFTGPESKWVQVIKDFMEVPIFADAIYKCIEILSQNDIYVMSTLIAEETPFILTEKSDIFVITTSAQIALLELLTYINIIPSQVMGYSIGELACAYYNNYITFKEAILCSYYLGLYYNDHKNAKCLMLNMEKKNENIIDELVPGLEEVYMNSDLNSLVFGPFNEIDRFIKDLQQQNISFVDLHSTEFYCSDSAKTIISSALEQLILANPYSKKNKEINNTSSKEFQKYSELLSLLLLYNSKNSYEETLKPIVSEKSSCDIVTSSHSNSADFFLSAEHCALERFLENIGNLYSIGYNPRIEKIYSKISFPVSRGTPMISPLIKWNHSDDWFVAKFDYINKSISCKKTYSININKSEYEYVAGHVIDERVLFPATGYLTLVWKSFAAIKEKKYLDLSVAFENVKFLRATKIDPNTQVMLTTVIQQDSGNFEITEGDSVIVTGRISILNEIYDQPILNLEENEFHIELNTHDIYKELKLRGYNYSGLFRGLKSCDPTVTTGQIYWKDNWVPFMDSMLQMLALQEDTRTLFLPTGIEQLKINVQKHKDIVDTLSENETISARAFKQFKSIFCGGIEIRGIELNSINRKKLLEEPILETYKFIPNTINDSNISFEQSVRILIQIVIENCHQNVIKTVEVIKEDKLDLSNLISPIIAKTIADWPLKHFDVNILSQNINKIDGINVSSKKLTDEANCVIAVLNDICRNQQVLQSALNATIESGFILTRESLHSNLSEVPLDNLNIIAEHKLHSERLILFSKISKKKVNNFVNLTDINKEFKWLPVLQNTLENDTNLCIYSHGDKYNGILGFSNCLRFEPGTENVSCICIMDDNAPPFDPNQEFYANQIKKNMTVNVFKNGQWGTYRHLQMNKELSVEVKHAYVNNTIVGDLSSLTWVEGQYSNRLATDSNKVLVHVYYSALNFRDIMTATGRIPREVITKGRLEESVIGLEYSGKLENGDRVMGLVPNLAMSNLIYTSAHLFLPVPNNWSLEDAATVPMAYGTVLYALVSIGNIQPGMSILIHSGTGGIGQAAINIALYYNCTVYVTVGDYKKREFIKRYWPQIKDNQIGDSHSTSFEEMIRRETNGKGVNIVLNSLSEDKFQASVRCVCDGGRFIEIGKYDISKNNPLDSGVFQKSISFHAFMLDSFFYLAEFHMQRVINLINIHLKNGAIKPLKRYIFTKNKIEDMFRFMTSGKHMGKILLKIREEEFESNTKPTFKLVKAHPRCYFSNTTSHIVIGGLGGVGLELIDWLIIRGVRKLIINSRKGISTGYQAMKMKLWKSYGVQIYISTADVLTYNGCEDIIIQASKLGPVETFFNMGAILRDGLFMNQTQENFKLSLGIKVITTKYFDELTRELCPDLKYFVVFSSVSSGKGNIGVSNYGMSNSAKERIIEKRKEDGFPSLAIQWGAIGDVGVLADVEIKQQNQILFAGTLPQKISHCLLTLDLYLCQEEPICSCTIIPEKHDYQHTATSTNITDVILKILGISNIKTISQNLNLAELGIDSIMTVELQQTMEREFNIFLKPSEIRSLTFARLQEIGSTKEQAAESKLETKIEN